jgi:UDPglucose 6-dehydrogenase
MVIKSMDIEDSFGFSADIKKSLSTTTMCFISEGVSSETNEQMDHVLNTAKIVGEHMSQHMFIIDRSEESMSRISQIKETIQEELSKRNTSLTFEVIANPNFLRA